MLHDLQAWPQGLVPDPPAPLPWCVTAGAHLTGGDALRNFGPGRCVVPTISGCGGCQPEAGTSGLQLASGTSMA
jgi:hypothetical protein